MSIANASLLIVDDTPENLAVLAELLQPLYHVRAATSGEQALRLVQHAKPDLLLLDVMMPGMSGYQVFEHLRARPETSDIPAIFITALTAEEDEIRGLELGAVDYITKPINPPILLARVTTQLELKQARDRLKDQNAWLEAEVARRMRENDLTQQSAIRALAHLAETRDPETGNHILRTQGYVEVLAHALKSHPRFETTLNAHTVDLLVRSAPLHDIGKVGVPDAILQKPGPLTADEWDVMKTHTTLGVQAIELAEQDARQPLPFLALAKEIAGSHHEKWDGSGYPQGLAGERIPVSARLMALADVFDALISARVYKPPFTLDEARAVIARGRGTHFDPDVVEAFEANFERFIAIAARHSEEQ